MEGDEKSAFNLGVARVEGLEDLVEQGFGLCLVQEKMLRAI